MSHLAAGRVTALTVWLVSVGMLHGLSPDSGAQQPPTGPPVHVPSAERFTDQELGAFARAYPAVTDLMEQGQRNDRSSAAFSAARTRVIEEQGLSVELYNRIATAMNRDPRLRARIERLVEQPARDRPR